MATGRFRTPLAIVLVLTGLFAVGAGLGALVGSLDLSHLLFGTGNQSAGLRSHSQPTRIKIPALEVDARVRPVGLDPDGSIAAPPLRRAHEAGWYEDGPSPGQDGPAVIVGHVDDRSGPAVFYGAANLPPGSRIEITRRDRYVAVFEVTQVRSYDKSHLPVEEVYGDFSGPELRLITCGGDWLGGETGYSDNVIVFARLVGD